MEQTEYEKAVTADLNARAELVSAVAKALTALTVCGQWFAPLGKQLVEKAVAEAMKG